MQCENVEKIIKWYPVSMWAVFKLWIKCGQCGKERRQLFIINLIHNCGKQKSRKEGCFFTYNW